MYYFSNLDVSHTFTKPKEKQKLHSGRQGWYWYEKVLKVEKTQRSRNKSAAQRCRGYLRTAV